MSAGVAQARSEAKKQRDKPYNDIKKRIQEARQPNRQSRATAARMLTRMIESNKANRQMQQTHHRAVESQSQAPKEGPTRKQRNELQNQLHVSRDER